MQPHGSGADARSSDLSLKGQVSFHIRKQLLRKSDQLLCILFHHAAFFITVKEIGRPFGIKGKATAIVTQKRRDLFHLQHGVRP